MQSIRRIKTMPYEESRSWADTFIEQQYDILNNCINDLDFNKVRRRGVQIHPAPDYDDQHLETDVIMFGTLRIALRVRNGQSDTFNDIALRSRRPSGCLTEVDKIEAGLGDYYLYCWTADGVNITEWILFDLDRFRENMDECFSFEHHNSDGSAFKTYSIDQMIECGCCVDSFLSVLT